jgi:hypothetical protein
MDQRQNVLKLLSEIKVSLDTNNREEAYSSTSNVQSIFERFYSKDSQYIKDFGYIRQSLGYMVNAKSAKTVYGKDLSEIKDIYRRLLDSLIKEIEILGIPSNNDIKIDKSVKVNVNQQQIQEQSQILQLSLFLEFIKDDITGKQYKDLIEIAKSEPSPEKAKPKIIEKLKSFGENVCSNIIANILTNPSIWNSMIG